MANSERNAERDGLAAEYVLGTLDPAERMQAERLLRTDPAFKREVSAWYVKLEPLIDTVGEADVPPTGLAGVFAKIDAAPDSEGAAQVLKLRRKLSLWRGAAAATAALAASLAVYIATGQRPPAPAEQFVAVLETQDRTPAFVASIDPGSGRIDVVRLASRPAQGRSYELWALGAGRQAPESLGVIETRADIPANRLGTLDAARLRDTTFAISDEPEGGSPTGQPTGPVLFTGKIVPFAGR